MDLLKSVNMERLARNLQLRLQVNRPLGGDLTLQEEH